MRHLRTVLVLGFSAAVATLPAPSPRQTPPGPVVTLQVAVSDRTQRILHVTFSGASSLPDAAVVRFRLHRLEETDRQGKLERTLVPSGNGAVETTRGSFTFDQILRGPGIYRVELGLPESQDPGRRWEFDFDLWGDDLLSRVEAERDLLESIAGEILRLTVRASMAAMGPRTWGLKSLELVRKMEETADRLDDGVAPLLPAAREDLRRAIASLREASRHFFWTDDGAFGGAYDSTADRWVLGPDGAPFTFGRILSFIDRSEKVARREHNLWIVKDARRAARNAPGLRHRPQTRTLLAEMDGTLDRIEAAVRAPGSVAAPARLAPTPPLFVEAATHRERVREARKILEEADLLWDQLNDLRAPALYRQLLREYPDLVEGFRARVRVGNRARAESE